MDWLSQNSYFEYRYFGCNQFINVPKTDLTNQIISIPVESTEMNYTSNTYFKDGVGEGNSGGLFFKKKQQII